MLGILVLISISANAGETKYNNKISDETKGTIIMLMLTMTVMTMKMMTIITMMKMKIMITTIMMKMTTMMMEIIITIMNMMRKTRTI